MMLRRMMLRRRADPQHFVRACAVEMHRDISQEPFCREFFKMKDAPATTSMKHRALTVTVRNPSVWPHCLGNRSSDKKCHHSPYSIP